MSGASMRTSKKAAKSRAAKRLHINTTPLYILLVVLLAAYILSQGSPAIASLAGGAVFMLIIVLLAIEFINGYRETGFIRSIAEIAIAIIIVIAFWYALGALLRTSDPIDVVPSCSMLPALQRGDLIILQGTDQSLSGIKAPVIDMTKAQFAGLLGEISAGPLECIAYKRAGSSVYLSQYVGTGYSVGLYRSSPSGGGVLMQNSSQSGGVIGYECGTAQVRFQNGTVLTEAYTTAIRVLNTTISGDQNNTIVVYETTPQDSFYRQGDSLIVHRLYAVLNVSGSYYFLTKGDNNPGLDIQYGNYPPNSTQIEGRVVLSVPYLGFVKLAFSGGAQPQGCNSTVLH